MSVIFQDKSGLRGHHNGRILDADIFCIRCASTTACAIQMYGNQATVQVIETESAAGCSWCGLNDNGEALEQAR